jgi:hypothetical protein
MINGAGWVSGLTGSYLRARAPAIGRQPGLIETVPLIAADQATVIAGEPAP